MKVVTQDGLWPSYDTFWHIFDWTKFEDDPRTNNLRLYFGCNYDVNSLDKEKVNVFLSGEHPGIFFVGKQPGVNLPNQIRMEEAFDYKLTYNPMVAESGRGYDLVTYPYDVEHVYKNLNLSPERMPEKTFDVTLCGTNPAPDRPLKSWVSVMQNYKHSFCSPHPPGELKNWEDKQMDIAMSKSNIVFSVFFGSDVRAKIFSESNFPWIKFILDPELGRWVVTQFKPRIHDSAAMKSLMLCYKDPFADLPHPYKTPIEYYYEPDVDFLYFENSSHLNEILQDVKENFDAPKYKNMIDSAYTKLVNNYTTEIWYEKYIVPLALSGKQNGKK